MINLHFSLPQSTGQRVLELHISPLIAPKAVAVGEWVGLQKQLADDFTSNCTTFCWGFT